MLTIKSAAHRDLRNAAMWYRRRGLLVAIRFMDAFHACLQRLEGNPFTHAVGHAPYRAARVANFPYVVYYRTDGHDVIVRALIHTARSSRYHRRRLAPPE